MKEIITRYQSLIAGILKVMFTLGAGYYLWQHTDLLSIATHLFQNLSIKMLLIMLIFSILNWFFEIKKWQALASEVQKIDFHQATKQSLVSFAVSLLTPNRIGEYGAKVLYYPKKHQAKIFSLSVIGTSSQLLISLLFGISALVFSKTTYLDTYPAVFSKKIYLVLLILLGAFLLLIYIKNKKQYLLFKASVWRTSLFYALVRYLIFSTQFLWLLLYFHKEANILQILPLIYITYFFSSLIPMFSFLDWTVKGSVALWVFKNVLPGQIVVQSIGLMWIFNFLLPFLLGSLYLYRQRLLTPKI